MLNLTKPANYSTAAYSEHGTNLHAQFAPFWLQYDDANLMQNLGKQTTQWKLTWLSPCTSTFLGDS